MTAAATYGPADARAVSQVDAASFHNIRPRLFGIAYRVVRNRADADDIVQDTWVRWQTADRSKVRDAAAFLATTTLRLAINLTQTARARRVTAIEPWHSEEVDPEADPTTHAERGQALQIAVRVLLERLTPGERAAYILREGFDYPYRDIAKVLGLSEGNARQLVRRARKSLDSGRRNPVGVAEHRRLATAFLAAVQDGDLATLEELLATGHRRQWRPAVHSAARCGMRSPAW